MASPLRVALIGHGFMGAVHSHAWLAVSRAFDIGVPIEMSVICGSPQSADALAVIASRYGWRSFSTNWNEEVERSDIDIVDVSVPGDLHKDVTLAALAAGKHVLCEKPLASSVVDAEEMAKAAERARISGVRSMVGFNYRRVPAIALAREIIEDGQIGSPRHIRGSYLQDWLVDANVPLTWRMQRERAGSGALGDIGSHLIDLSQYLTSSHVSGVSAITRTFINERPLPSANGVFLGGTGGAGRGTVSVDDAFVAIATLSGGALATLEATRMAMGHKNALRIEVNGSEGSVAFDFERMNELLFFDGSNRSRSNGFRRILATEPTHPYLGAWWPPGHGLGYDHTFVNEIGDFIHAIVDNSDPNPGFAEGLQIQRVMAAIEVSAEQSANWVPIVDVPLS